MPKHWDDTTKRLIRLNPHHFVRWILKGALFKDALSIELKNWTRESDFLLDVILNGAPMLLHLELQSVDDADMAQRLLEYNILATREHSRKVLSCVIYLRPDKDIAESPLIWTLPDGQEVLRFHFLAIKLWEIPAEDILQTDLVGLLPLLPLTKDGKGHEVIDEMVRRIVASGQRKLLSLAKAFATLAFKDPADHEWLERRFAMYKDIIEESWFFQETFQKGELQALHLAVLDVIQERFPEIVSFAKKQIEGVGSTEVLRRLIVKMSTAQTPEEALQYLFTITTGEKKN